MSDAELSPQRMERSDSSGHTDMPASARPTAGSSEGSTPAEDLYGLDDVQDTGPTVAAGRWLGEEDLWLASGSQWAVRPPPGALQRPARFRKLPLWVSGILLAAVLALVFIAVISVARTAHSYLPHHAATPVVQHTPTPKPKHTATPAH
jgi:hypothetical protein